MVKVRSVFDRLIRIPKLCYFLLKYNSAVSLKDIIYYIYSSIKIVMR